MNVAFIILTYERPNITKECIQTLFNNTKIKPREVYILDDGSNPNMRQSLLNFSIEHSEHIPINFYSNGRNKGVGYQFETAYKIADSLEDIDVVCFIEADYIWRKGWLEDVLAVFEASPQTIAIAGTDHPDMEDRAKTHGEFCKLMISQFGKDLESRPYLYKPFVLGTSRGDILVEGVSNSCGCQVINWRRLKKILYNGDSVNHSGYDTWSYWHWMDRAFHKNGTGDRKHASDAHMSGTLSMFAERYMKDYLIDFTRNFGMLNICDYSISSHICGGHTSINGKIVPEGQTFIISPSWKNEYLNIDPREKLENQ